jgi:hypothetical protein
VTQTRPGNWLADVERALAPGARVVIAAALASLMLVAIGGALAWRSYIDRADREQELVADAALDAARSVSQFFADRFAVLQAMAEMPGVAESDMDSIVAIVGAAGREALGFSGGVGWVDPNGLLQASSVAEPGELPVDLSDRVFVIRALDSGLPSIGDVLMARLTAEMVAIIAVPTHSNEQVNGVLLGYVALDRFDAAIPSLVPPGLVTRVVDRGGSVILTNGLAAGPYVPENGALLHGPSSTRGAGLMGQPDRMIGMAVVPDTGWTVVVEQDRLLLLAGSRGRFLGEVGVLILLSLITVGVAGIAAVRMDSSHRQMLVGARNLSALEALSEKLSAAPSARDVADAVLEVFGSVFDAEAVVVGLADSDERLKAYTIADDLGSPHPDLPDEVVSMDDHSILVDAFESLDELFLSRSELETRYPDLVLPPAATGVMTGRFVGRNARGSVCLFVHGEFPPASSEAELFVTMVPLLGDAFGRAAAAESQRLAARAFQQALLPRDTIGLEVELQRAVRYIAAVGDVGVGGDWYDLWMVDDERVGAVVGDVVGRGVEAAAAMGQLRSALRATTAASKTPGDALAQLDSLVGQISGSPSATVLLSTFDTERRIFHLASAGHLPPLLATKGHVRAMYEVRGTPVGFLNQPMTRVTMAAELEPEDTLVFYTDGLVERRGESIDQGIERLQRSLSEHRHLGVEALADQLLKSCLEPENQDDVALLVLRLVGSDPTSFTRSSSIEGFADVLDEIRAWGAGRVDEGAIAHLVNRLGEAHEVVLRCTAHDPIGDLVVEVSEAEPGPLRATLEFRRVAVESGTARVNRMILRGWRYGELIPGGARLELGVGGAPPSDLV